MAYTPGSINGNSGARKGSFQKGAYDLYTMLLPLLQKKYQFAQQLQPQEEAILQQVLGQLTPEGLQNMANWYRQNAQGAATSAGQTQAGQLRALGASQGAQAGAVVNAQNMATKDANAYSQNMLSPQNQLNTAGSALNLINGAQNPDLSGLFGLGSSIYGKPAATHQSGSLLSTIGSAAGMFTGMGGDFGQVFSGGAKNPAAGLNTTDWSLLG